MITYGRRGSAREGNDRPHVPRAYVYAAFTPAVWLRWPKPAKLLTYLRSVRFFLRSVWLSGGRGERDGIRVLPRARDRVHGTRMLQGSYEIADGARGENRRGFTGSESRGADRNLVATQFVEQLKPPGEITGTHHL